MTAGRSRPWLRRLLLGALALALLYALFTVAADAGEVLDALRRLPGRVVAAALALVAAAFLLRGLRWRLYLWRMGLAGPAGRVGLPASLAMGVASGKWGQVVKAHYLARIGRVPYAASLPAVLADRVSDVAAALLLLATGLAVAPGGDWRAALGAGLVLAAAVAALRSPRVAGFLVDAASRLRPVRRHREALLGALGDLRGHLGLARLAPPSAIGLSAFLLEALALHVLAQGMGLPVGVGLAVLLLGTADVAGLVSFLPAGLLAVEGSLVAVLVLHGVGLADAAALTLVFRACTLWWGVGLGVGGVGLLHAQARRVAGARSRSI